jgi:hypothetical protein
MRIDAPLLATLVLCAAAAVPSSASTSDRATAPDSTAVERAAHAFRSKVPLNAPLLDRDPYEKYRAGTPLPEERAVCALRYESDRLHYSLRTFGDENAARSAGFTITHKGSCGTCSTLQDLAAYLSRPDLTKPVRQCALRGITRGRTLGCLKGLGFSDACAETWYYNSRNTRKHCFGVCLASLLSGEPSNKPDGTLNDCLRCDEEKSGPVFKLVAGRTRRNSGIQSSIDRIDGEIYPLVHDYY